MLAMFTSRDLESILEIFLWLEAIVLVFTAASYWSSHACASTWNVMPLSLEASQEDGAKKGLFLLQWFCFAFTWVLLYTRLA